MPDLVLTQTPWLPNTFVDKLRHELGLRPSDLQWPSVSWQALQKGSAQDAMLFGSHSARARRCLTQTDLEWFLRDAPQGYAMVGFWGYGVNSYAFYYARVDAWSRVYLRLPYGGMYMDNDQAAARARLFVQSLFAFERRIQLATSSWSAIEAGERSVFARTHGSNQWRLEGSILQDDDPLVTLESNLL